MLTVESSMHVPQIRAAQVIDFFLHPRDDLYRRWWPGVHFGMHPLNETIGIGQEIYMDELVGRRRLRFSCLVTDLSSDSITWQFRRLVLLPCWLVLTIADDEDGATITHSIRAGYRSGFGRLLDPFLRLYFSRTFEHAMEEHFRTEFSALPLVFDNAESASVQ